MTNACSNCSHENRPGARFCGSCGADLPVGGALPPQVGEPSAATGYNASPVGSGVSSQSPPAQSPTTVHHEGSSRRFGGRSWLLAIPIVLLFMVGLVWLVGRNGDQPADDIEAAATTSVDEQPTSTATPAVGTILAEVTPITAAPTTVPPTTDSTTTTTTTTSTLPPDPRVAALQSLQALMATDDQTVALLADQWIPQLSAKFEGQDWQNTMWGYPEILAEHQGLRERFGAVLVDGGTYNFRSGGEPMAGWFVSVAPVPYGTAEGALGWCTANGFGRDDCLAKLISTRDDLGTTVRLLP